MSVAVTFRRQTEDERGENENSYSFFRGSEAESLPRFIKFGTPALFNHK